MLMTAEDVLADLGGETSRCSGPGGSPATSDRRARRGAATAWDCLVRVVRARVMPLSRAASSAASGLLRSVDRLVAVDARVAGRVDLLQLLGKAEADEHDGDDQGDQDHSPTQPATTLLSSGLGSRGRTQHDEHGSSVSGARRVSDRDPGEEVVFREEVSTWLVDQLVVLGRPRLLLDLARHENQDRPGRSASHAPAAPGHARRSSHRTGRASSSACPRRRRGPSSPGARRTATRGRARASRRGWP